jgi:hypothetical protein
LGGGFETQKTINFGGKPSFTRLSFFPNASPAAATYIFTAFTIIPLEPCALNAETQHFITQI